MKIFSGTASKDVAEKISSILGFPHFSFDQHIFPDGERRVRVIQDVVDASTVLIQSANQPVDSNYMELFFMIDSLKRSGAEFVTAVVPYFGYQRQDHIFRDGEAVSLEVVIRILESLGISKLISVDMHSIKIPDLFHIPVMHLSAMSLFAEKIRSLVISSEVERSHAGISHQRFEMTTFYKETVLISPDMGGIARIKALSSILDDMPFVALEKNRDLQTGSLTVDSVKDGSIHGKKRAIMVDDLISSGSTVIKGAEFLKKQGIEEVIVMATHAIFSEDASQKLQESLITKVFVTDTVVVPKEKQFGKLEVLSIAPLIAEVIKS